MAPRALRPDRTVASNGAVWLVDESWPAAAIVDLDGVITLMAWPWSTSGPDPDRGRGVVPDNVGIVVQDGGVLAWVRRDGVQTAWVDPGLVLAAADPQVAWCVDGSYVDPGHPPGLPPPLSPGRIVAASRGGVWRIDAPAPVLDVALRGNDVWVTLAEPPLARPTEFGSWRFEYPFAVLRATRDDLLAHGLSACAPSDEDPPNSWRRHPVAWSWLETDRETVLEHGVRTAGLAWWAGALHGGDRIERRALVVGHDPANGRPMVRADLGIGLVRDVQAVGGELWVVVARRRYLAVPQDHGVEIVAVSGSGSVRTVYAADSVDISWCAPALRRPSDEQIEAHVERVRAMFDSLDEYWITEDGSAGPLSNGLTDAAVAVSGSWPDIQLIITLRHARRPGLLLRRTLRLFDDTGEPISHEYADIHLMEDLDTDYLAPASEAVGGVLDT